MLDVIAHGFYPAGIHPEHRPTKVGSRIINSPSRGRVTIDPLTDAAVLCSCSAGRSAHAREPMEILAGEFGRTIRVRCTDATCDASRYALKVNLRGVDRNSHAPGSAISKGEWNPRKISQLPTWTDFYVAQRFLALQRVEWVHASFERLFGLGGKNKSFERRKISGTHPNQVWWALAGLIWNITLSLTSPTAAVSSRTRRRGHPEGRSQLLEEGSPDPADQGTDGETPLQLVAPHRSSARKGRPQGGPFLGAPAVPVGR